ncbi:hypothetical protein [Halothiobacillus diazotrophicus]|uniref:hypothetical protein n=1 Tax=Halothiobacillus diazotrophicus TaxID=1860122 RepID=UPI0012E8D8DE|nr:hypothetical protein [Halothiobacillus diazotrophicus]
MNTKNIQKMLLNRPGVLSIALLGIALIGSITITKAAPKLPDEATGNAGTLSYSGFISGKITFHSSECAHINNTLGMTLPYQPRYPDNIQPPPPDPGPYLLFSSPGHGVDLRLNIRNQTATNTFFSMNRPAGITWGSKQGIWFVTFNNFEIYDSEYKVGKEARPITLNGTLTCLYDEKDRYKPITPYP